jgi:chromosome segregation ATPase
MNDERPFETAADTQAAAVLQQIAGEREARRAAEESLGRMKLELEDAIAALRGEIADRARAQAELGRVNGELEAHIARRTQDLVKTNTRLEQAMGEFLALDRAHREERDTAETAAQRLRDRLRHASAHAVALSAAMRDRLEPEAMVALERLLSELESGRAAAEIPRVAVRY